MCSEHGFPLVICLGFLLLDSLFGNDKLFALRFLFSLIIIIKATSDYLLNFFGPMPWSCIYCGKTHRGSLVDEIITICDHEGNL